MLNNVHTTWTSWPDVGPTFCRQVLGACVLCVAGIKMLDADREPILVSTQQRPQHVDIDRLCGRG